MPSVRFRRSFPIARAQRGAALFMALMILIVLTMLALSASQVTGLQERMAGIYRADNLAFEAAETRLRQSEAFVARANPLICDGLPQPRVPANWLDTTGKVADTRLENLTNATSPYSRGINYRGSLAVGQQRTVGSINCLVFRNTSYGFDNDDEPTSRSLVQSMYTP